MEDKMIIVSCTVAIIIVFIAVLFVFIWWMVSWYCAKNTGPKIKFKSFKTFYELNPDRWDLYDDHIACKVIDHNGAYKGLFTHKELFWFGPIDFLKYKSWMWHQERHENKLNNAEVTARMIASVKHDIETIERRANKYQNQAANDLQHILNNIKQQRNDRK